MTSDTTPAITMQFGWTIVYVDDPADLERVRALCAAIPGVAEVLDRAGQAAHGLDHERAGELVLVADETAWFN